MRLTLPKDRGGNHNHTHTPTNLQYLQKPQYNFGNHSVMTIRSQHCPALRVLLFLHSVQLCSHPASPESSAVWLWMEWVNRALEDGKTFSSCCSPQFLPSP